MTGNFSILGKFIYSPINSYSISIKMAARWALRVTVGQLNQDYPN